MRPARKHMAKPGRKAHSRLFPLVKLRWLSGSRALAFRFSSRVFATLHGRRVIDKFVNVNMSTKSNRTKRDFHHW